MYANNDKQRKEIYTENAKTAYHMNQQTVALSGWTYCIYYIHILSL